MLLPIVKDEDPCHIALTQHESFIQAALKKLMKENASTWSWSWRGEYNINFLTWIWYFRTSEGKAFLTTWLSKFIFGGFSNHEIMVDCIPLATRLAEGVKLFLALLMLGALYHMLDLLYFDEILCARYYIIETYVCLSLLQIFAWERFHPYHFGRVTSSKDLEYPMAKCGYTNGMSPLTCLWKGERKVKGQVVLEVNSFLDDHDSFNFHTHKTMLETFALPKVSLFNKTLTLMPENQIVDFAIGNLGHLKMLTVIMPSMLPCITWQGLWGLESYCPKRVAWKFSYDQDIPSPSFSNKSYWDIVMRPYIVEIATAM
ncbi:hypothetical protein SLEP1_g22641 [Rubroshorea leprosula]|uniref:Aminotransferase-like plant mobile domain-containing protein n=1 Tax=Rubroshorea leprosula TaxID=152421 RepID=A0AAV5JJ69_9ROSI|nr:hypothetical protein SLEP1_g22641 [Rubroshorea leprosula]